MAVEFQRVVPIMRIFDIEKAKEFYVDYLGFKVDWEHRFEAGLPLYLQVSRGNLVLHLSEHHGDSTPGSTVRVDKQGVDELHRELSTKNYSYLRPGVQVQPWNSKELQVIDPFGNRIRFSERAD